MFDISDLNIAASCYVNIWHCVVVLTRAQPPSLPASYFLLLSCLSPVSKCVCLCLYLQVYFGARKAVAFPLLNIEPSLFCKNTQDRPCLLEQHGLFFGFLVKGGVCDV